MFLSHKAHWPFSFFTKGMYVQYMHRTHCKWGFCCVHQITPRMVFVTFIRKDRKTWKTKQTKKNLLKSKGILVWHKTILWSYINQTCMLFRQQIWKFRNSFSRATGPHIHGSLTCYEEHLHGQGGFSTIHLSWLRLRDQWDEFGSYHIYICFIHNFILHSISKTARILSLIMNRKKQVTYTTSVYFLVLFVCKGVAVMDWPLLGWPGWALLFFSLMAPDLCLKWSVSQQPSEKVDKQFLLRWGHAFYHATVLLPSKENSPQRRYQELTSKPESIPVLRHVTKRIHKPSHTPQAPPSPINPPNSFLV